MIFVTPFSLSALSQYKCFYVLDKLPKHSSEVGVWIKTPTGIDPVDFVNVFSFPDGTLVAAWSDPLTSLVLHNVVAQTDGSTQVINLSSLERVIDIYNRPPDSTFGTFSFGASIPIQSGDWRCYRGMYGFWQFSNDNHDDEIVSEVSEILVFETLLNLNGVAHVVYVEATNKEQIAYQKINNSIAPASGRTLQELLRLIYEWDVVAREPFNSTDPPAVAAREFVDALGFTTEELAVLSQLHEMQIASYIQGNENARLRPDGIEPMSEDVRRMVFKRMSSMTLSALLTLHDLDFDDDVINKTSVFEEEQRQLNIEVQRFRDYYRVGLDIPITDTYRVVKEALKTQPAYQALIHNQLRMLNNKRDVLSRVSNGSL